MTVDNKTSNSAAEAISTTFELAIIGSGPAGIAAAVQAAKLGRRVAIIERDPENIGGAWIHTGTVPSKTLREVAEAIHSVKFHVGNCWVERMIHDLSPTTLFGRARQVATQEENHVRKFLLKNGVQIIKGRGQIEHETAVRVVAPDTKPYVVNANHILIATGSRPRRPSDIPFDGWRVVDSDEILRLESLPRRMAVYGAGVIGCEYACIFNALGCDVTIYDARGRVMQALDQEITEELKKIMEAQGIKFCMNHELRDVKVDGPEVSVSFNDGAISTSVDLLFLQLVVFPIRTASVSIGLPSKLTIAALSRSTSTFRQRRRRSTPPVTPSAFPP